MRISDASIPAFSGFFTDDWFEVDSVVNGTRKISPAVLYALRNAYAPSNGIACDGSDQANRITVEIPTACAIADFPRGFFFNFQLPAANPGSTVIIATWGDAASPTANFLEVAMTSAGALRFRIYGTTTSDYLETTVAGVTATYGALRDISVQFGGDTAGRDCRINGVAATLTSDTTGGSAPANWQAPLTSTVFALHGGLAYVFRSFWPCKFRPTLADAEQSYFMGGVVPMKYRWGADYFSGNNATFTSGPGNWVAAEGGGTVGVSGGALVISNMTAANFAGAKFHAPGTFSRIVTGYSYIWRGTISASNGSTRLMKYGASNYFDQTLATFPGDGTYLVQFTPTDYSWYDAGNREIALVGHTGVATGAATTATLDDTQLTRLGALFFLSAQAGALTGMGAQLHDLSPFKADAALPTAGWTRLYTAPIGTRIGVRKSYNHATLSQTAATTSPGWLPAGWIVREVQANVTTAFDSGTTLDFGITGTLAKYVSALAVGTTGFKRADSLSLLPESASAGTTLYVKKNQATTTGAVEVSYIVERIY